MTVTTSVSLDFVAATPIAVRPLVADEARGLGGDVDAEPLELLDA